MVGLYLFKQWTARIFQIPVEELNAYLNYYRFRNNHSTIKVIIFGQGRSGSTLLENLLASTGYFEERGELLGPRPNEIKNPYKYILGLAKSSNNFLFHLKIYHLTRDRQNKKDCKVFLEKLYRDGWKIIFLDRRNKIEQTLSTHIAQHTQTYHKLNVEIEKPLIKIDIERFQREVRERDQFRKEELEALSNIKYLQIYYEEDLKSNQNHQQTVDKILDFLNLERRPSSTNYHRINTYDSREIIINYDEFKEMVENLSSTKGMI